MDRLQRSTREEYAGISVSSVVPSPTPNRGYGNRHIAITDDALAHLAHVAGGDARTALNALELAVESTRPDPDGVVHIDLDIAQESIQRRMVRYDKGGDEHYDTISAFIKSVRGSEAPPSTGSPR